MLPAWLDDPHDYMQGLLRSATTAIPVTTLQHFDRALTAQNGTSP